MFGVSVIELAIVGVISLCFFKPSEILNVLQKIVLLIERIKDEVYFLKNRIILEEEVSKDILPSVEVSEAETAEDETTNI